MSRLSNHEIVTLAVYLLGGESRGADTEDIAMKANEIAPGRFAWRKYPSQVNIDTVRKRLWDACKPEKGGYLIGSEKQGWILTERGTEFAKRVALAVADLDLSRLPMNRSEQSRLRRERTRLLASEAFEKFTGQKPETITVHEAESFFRLDDYVIGAARQRKITRLLNVFGTDADLAPVVTYLAKKLAEGN